MKKLMLGTLLAIAVLTMGCGTKRLYVRPGGTNDAFQQDYADCKMYANQMGVTASSGGSSSLTLGGAMGSGIAGGIIQTIEMKRAMDLCLESRGWTLQ